MKRENRMWIWSCVTAAVSSFLLGLSLVWVNMELIDLSYSIKQLQSVHESQKNLKAKLEIEWMNLTSTYRLRNKASEYGLQSPEVNQVRKLE